MTSKKNWLETPPTKEEIAALPALTKEQIAKNPFLTPQHTGQIDGPTAQLVIDAIHTRFIEGMPVQVSELASITKLPARVVKQLLNEMTTSGECSVIKIDDERFLVGEYPDTAQ